MRSLCEHFCPLSSSSFLLSSILLLYPFLLFLPSVLVVFYPCLALSIPSSNLNLPQTHLPPETHWPYKFILPSTLRSTNSIQLWINSLLQTALDKPSPDRPSFDGPRSTGQKPSLASALTRKPNNLHFNSEYLYYSIPRTTNLK